MRQPTSVGDVIDVDLYQLSVADNERAINLSNAMPLWRNPSMIQSFHNMESDNGSRGSLAVKFTAPKAGRMQLTLTTDVYQQSYVIELYGNQDPIPDMIEWLERIARGELPAEIRIDQPFTENRLLAMASSLESEVQFMACGNHGGAEFGMIIDRLELLRKFVQSLCRWLSDDYDPTEYNQADSARFVSPKPIDLRTIDLGSLTAKIPSK